MIAQRPSSVARPPLHFPRFPPHTGNDALDAKIARFEYGRFANGAGGSDRSRDFTATHAFAQRAASGKGEAEAGQLALSMTVTSDAKRFAETLLSYQSAGPVTALGGRRR